LTAADRLAESINSGRASMNFFLISSLNLVTNKMFFTRAARGGAN
jgi:hypothetical protein